MPRTTHLQDLVAPRSRTLWRVVGSLALMTAAAVAQQDTSSASYSSHCTIVAPAVGTTASASFATFLVAGPLESTEIASASYRMRLDPFCTGGAGGGCAVIICGDCDGDGRVTVLDALAAARHASGAIVLMGLAYDSCNVDGDGDVDVLDALRIAQFATGLPVALMCC